MVPTRAGTGDGIRQPEEISSSEDESDQGHPEPEPFTGVNKKAVFAAIMKVVVTFVMDIQEKLTIEARRETSRWSNSQPQSQEDQHEKAAEDAARAKRLFLMQRIKFFLDGANEHNQFFYDANGNPSKDAEAFIHMGWDIIKSAAGCSGIFQALDQSVTFKGLHRYFEPKYFATNIKKDLPTVPEIDEFIARKIHDKSAGGNFQTLEPALRRTFAIGLRHIWYQLDQHCARLFQNVASHKLVGAVPVGETPSEARAHAHSILSLYPLWNDLSLTVQEQLLEKVPRGIELVGMHGELQEKDYPVLFPDLPFMRASPGELRKDAGSLTRRRTLLWTHPFVLKGNQRKEESRVAKAKEHEEEVAKKEAEKLAKDEETASKKEEKRLKAERQQAVKEADIWQCMNMACGHAGPSTEDWQICDNAKMVGGKLASTGCPLFTCGNPICVALLDTHAPNCLYGPGALDRYMAEKQAVEERAAAEAAALAKSRSHKKRPKP